MQNNKGIFSLLGRLEISALVVVVTSLDFTDRGILKCVGRSRSNSPEEYEDHNFGQSSSSLKKLSLNSRISHRLVRTDFFREVVYHNNLIVVSHQKYLENVTLTKNIILRCQKMFCLRTILTSQLKHEK